ncbi:hypothetical protein [Spirosoma koreense]
MVKKYSLYPAIFFLLFLGLGVGCQNNPDPALDGSEYFPLEIGDYWIYQVTQEKYAPSNSVTKSVYQLQQKISSSYTQNGQLFYLLEESIKRSEQTGWQLNAIRTVYKNLKEVVGQEHNVPIVKMVFPVSTTTSWNINTYNANADTTLRYQDTGKAFTLGKLNFDRTISVLGADDSTLVDQERYRRVYAHNVGLVYSENISLAYCQSTPSCIGQAIIESGTKQKWELLSSNRLP